MEWPRAVRNLGLGLLLAAAAALAVILGLAVERFARGRDRALGQEMVIHHFERSSWFAMNAEPYAGIDPELTRRFREMAAWHARRAREFQRMDTGIVVREAERDLGHDILEGPLLERALKYDLLLGKKDQPPTEKAERHGADARAAPP